MTDLKNEQNLLCELKNGIQIVGKNLVFINISDYGLHQETNMLKTPKSETSQSIKVML